MGGGVVHLHGGVDPLHFGRREDAEVELGLIVGALEHLGLVELVHGFIDKSRPGRRGVGAELGGEKVYGFLEAHGPNVGRALAPSITGPSVDRGKSGAFAADEAGHGGDFEGAFRGEVADEIAVGVGQRRGEEVADAEVEKFGAG